MKRILFLLLSSVVILLVLTLSTVFSPPHMAAAQTTGLADRVSALETALADIYNVNSTLETRVSLLETQIQVEPTETATATSTTTPKLQKTPTPEPTTLATPNGSPASENEASSELKSDGANNPYNSAMIGNAQLELPAPKNDFDVIVVHRKDSLLQVFVRNNTDIPVKNVSVDTIAYASDGSLLAVADSIGYDPTLVRPGEVTYGTIYFGNVELPEDATFEFEVNFRKTDLLANSGDLLIDEYKFIENRFVGMLKNPWETEVTGPIVVNILCFDTEGNFLANYKDYATKDKILPGKRIPFQLDVRQECSSFLMFASGFAF